MRSRIDDELLRGSTINTQIDREIVSAIDHYKRKRFWFNEGTTTSSTAASGEYQARPATILDLDSLRITISSGTYPLDERHFSTLEQWSTGTTLTGQPTDFAPYKDTFRLYPIPDGIYTLTWAGLLDLGTPSVDADTSAWFTDGEELIRERAKAMVRINVIMDQAAAMERAGLASDPMGCVSFGERSALRELKRATARRTATGKVKAAC
jgi:hypothetical protein